MAIYAKKSEGGNFPPAPAGFHRALCVDVVDRGLHENKFKPGVKQSKVSIHFAIAPKRDDGKHHVIGKWFTLSMHAKSSLRPVIEAWRGVPFESDAKAYAFDVESLVGKACQIQIIHKPKEDGTKKAEIIAFVPFDGEPPVEFAEGYVRRKDRDVTTRDDDGHGEEVPF